MLIGVMDIPRFPHHAWSILPDLQGLLDGLVVRDKVGLAPSVLWTAKEIRAIAPDLPLWINSYVSVALCVPADALTLPADASPAASVRRLWNRPIMASVHNLQELEYHRGADYYLWGHAFPSTSKPGLEPRPWEDLLGIVHNADRPVLAIGGINPGNIQKLAATGIYGVCLADGLWCATDPVKVCQQLKRSVAFMNGTA